MGEGNNVVSINGAPVKPEPLSDGEIHTFRSPRGGLYLSCDGVPGTWLYSPSNKSDPWVQLIRYPFTVVGEVQSGLKKRGVGYLVQYTDEGRQVQGSAPGTFPVDTDVLPTADMMDPRRLRAWLASRNIKLLVTTPVLGQLTAPGVLAAYITASNHPRKIEERPVCGWVPKLDGYLLGSQVIGSDDYRPRLSLSETPPPIRSGTLDGWLEHIAPQAGQHPVWVCGVLIAMAAPLMHLLGKDKSCGGFHFHGDSSTGKSIAGELAAGFYGHKAQTWRTTSNALEWSAAMHNHSVLVLDEIHMGDPQDIDHAIFLLANGLGKVRMAKDGTAVPALEFSGLTISSGEKSVKETMPRDMSEGEIVRFLDVPMIYRDLDPLTVARFKERISNEQQGHIGQAWIEHLSGGSIHLQQPPIGERLVRWKALYEKYLSVGIRYADARDSRVVRIWQRLAGLMMVADIAADDLLLPRDWFEELPDPENHGFTNLCTQAVKQIYDQWADAHGVVRGSRSALSGARSDAGLLVDWVSECIAADKMGEFRATPAPNPECLPDAGYHYDGTTLPRNRNAIGGYIESVCLLNRSGKLSGDADRFLWIQARQLNTICTHVKGLRFIDAMKHRGILSMNNNRKRGKRGNQMRYPSVNWSPVLAHNDTGPNLGTNHAQAYRIDLKKLQDFADGMS